MFLRSFSRIGLAFARQLFVEKFSSRLEKHCKLPEPGPSVFGCRPRGDLFPGLQSMVLVVISLSVDRGNDESFETRAVISNKSSEKSPWNSPEYVTVLWVSLKSCSRVLCRPLFFDFSKSLNDSFLFRSRLEKSIVTVWCRRCFLDQTTLFRTIDRVPEAWMDVSVLRKCRGPFRSALGLSMAWNLGKNIWWWAILW